MTLNYYLFFNETINLKVLGLVFSSTLFTYNFQRLLKIQLKINLTGERVEWINSHVYTIYSITLISFLASIYFGLLFISKVWILFVLSGFISFFYVWKIPLLKGKNLRDIPGIKIYLIAFVWVVICVIMPFLLDSNIDYTSLSILSTSLFLFMVAITIPFDIRDIKLDDSSKKTIPQLIGIHKSVYLSIGLLVISQIILQLLLPFNIGIWIFTIIGIITLLSAKKPQAELFYSGIIDGLLVMQIGLIWGFV